MVDGQGRHHPGPLGSISYKHRGDEADRVKQVGLQGQTDLMINELFKNN